MLNLKTAFNKLSLHQLRMRCLEYQRLPLYDKQVLQTYAVASVLLVAALVMALSSFIHMH